MEQVRAGHNGQCWLSLLKERCKEVKWSLETVTIFATEHLKQEREKEKERHFVEGEVCWLGCPGFAKKLTKILSKLYVIN